MLRVLLSPRWLGLTLLLLVALGVFAFLGSLELSRARSGAASFVSYGYAVEWWLFAGIAMFLYARLLRSELAPPPLEAPTPGAARPPAPESVPTPAVIDYNDSDEDRELAAYNRYLAELNAARPDAHR